jgi:hypothetical protein
MVTDYGAMEVETPLMCDFEHPALSKYLQRFPARQYRVTSDDKEFFLRFAACFGQYMILHDMVASYRDLPLRRRDDGRVLLVPADAASALIPDPERFRSRRLLELTPSDFKTLVITRGAVSERLRRTEAGTFQLVEPAGHEHDAGAVLELVQALGTLEADRWAAPQAEPAHGLDHPTVTVEIGTEKSGKPETLRLVVQDDGVGRKASSNGGHGLGIDSTRTRLSALYGTAGQLRIDDTLPTGTLVTIELPFHIEALAPDAPETS